MNTMLQTYVKLTNAFASAKEERGATAVEDEHPGIRCPGIAEKIEHHCFVIAEHDLHVAVLSQSQDGLDHLARAVSTVDQVTDKIQMVGGGDVHSLEELVQLRGTSVDVTDRESPTLAHPPNDTRRKMPGLQRSAQLPPV